MVSRHSNSFNIILKKIDKQVIVIIFNISTFFCELRITCGMTYILLVKSNTPPQINNPELEHFIGNIVILMIVS